MSCQQAAQLFYVGLPSSYSLPVLEAPLPRLPSYESVRKKDRQRQIHMMIADRFGLNGSVETEVGDQSGRWQRCDRVVVGSLCVCLKGRPARPTIAESSHKAALITG